MALHDHRVVALPGRRVVDVRFRRVDKGLAILRWIGRAGARREDVLYAGDDTTDEDAFRALRAPSVTIAVGPGPKAAGFRTSGPPALSRWLRRLAEARR